MNAKLNLVSAGSTTAVAAALGIGIFRGIVSLFQSQGAQVNAWLRSGAPARRTPAPNRYNEKEQIR